MGSDSIEHHSVADTVAVNRFFFGFFLLVGVLLVAAGLITLRTDKRIRATGTVLAGEERYVFVPAAGKLEKLGVRIGERVEAGQSLFSMATEPLDLRVLEKTGQLAEMRRKQEEAEALLQRLEVRPGEVALLNAAKRLELLDEIQKIQQDILAAWNLLEGERAVRGLDYNVQRVATLRMQMEAIDLKLLAEWDEAGLAGLEKETAERNLTHWGELVAVLEQERAALEKQRADLEVVAPIAGKVVDIYFRYPGMTLEEGARVLKIVNPDSGYRVRAYVGERNIDLLGKGIPARMESQVFDSLFEGYVRGEIRRIVADAARGAGETAGEARYEVTIEVEETPYPLVLGSRMEIDFLLGRQTLVDLFSKRTSVRPVEKSEDRETP